MSRFLAACVVLSAVCGCGGSETDPGVVKTAPVKGVLTFDGKALEHYQVIFAPEAGGRGATALTDKEGRFEASTNAQRDGAPVGKNNVAVVYVGPPTNFEPGKEPLDYKPPAPPVKLPAKFQDPTKSGLTVDVPESGLNEYKLELK
jgi:hypothetical protein